MSEFFFQKRISLFEVLSVASLIFLWIYTAYSYPRLPATIPVHYTASDGVDRYGSKNTIWLLPLIAIFVYAGELALRKFYSSSAQKIEKYAAPSNGQLKHTLLLFQQLKLSILLALTYANCCLIWQQTSLEPWFLPVFFSALLLPTIIFIYRLTKS